MKKIFSSLLFLSIVFNIYSQNSKGLLFTVNKTEGVPDSVFYIYDFSIRALTITAFTSADGNITYNELSIRRNNPKYSTTHHILKFEKLANGGFYIQFNGGEFWVNYQKKEVKIKFHGDANIASKSQYAIMGSNPYVIEQNLVLIALEKKL
jgi:hypothetical protein